MISTIHPIPAFTDNYIWAAHDTDSKRVCVVDPGDALPVIEYLESNELKLSDILVTHHHSDHTGGVLELATRYSCRVIGPSSSGIKGITEFVSEEDSVTLFGQDFFVVEVPGHTLDHIAYYCSDENQIDPILFCGDTLFAAGCGRLFEGTPQMMYNSLEKLSALARSTRVYCTHEYTLANLRFAIAADAENPALLARIDQDEASRSEQRPTLPSTIELELATNPFLRCKEPGLLDIARKRLGRTPSDEIEVFATLRSWKDTF